MKQIVTKYPSRLFSTKPLSGSISQGQLKVSDVFNVIAIRHAQSTFNAECSAIEA